MSYPIFPMNTTVEKDNRVEFLTTLRLCVDGVYYLFDCTGSFSIDDSVGKFEAYQHFVFSNVYYYLVNPKVDLSLEDEDGNKMYRVDEDQTPEGDRFFRDHVKVL